MAQVLAESVTSVQQSSLSFAFPHLGRQTLGRRVPRKLQVKVVDMYPFGTVMDRNGLCGQVSKFRKSAAGVADRFGSPHQPWDLAVPIASMGGP